MMGKVGFPIDLFHLPFVSHVEHCEVTVVYLMGNNDHKRNENYSI
jgi:hypothetical protein